MNNPKLRMFPAWNRQPVHERLDLCVTALVVHGVITDAEKDRIRDRIQKRLSKGEYLAVFGK